MAVGKGKLEAGTKWGRLECIKVEKREDGLKDPDGNIFAEFTFEVYTFQCECGKQFEMTEEAWPGKRAMKDCGCGMSDNDGANVFFNFTGPLAVREAVTAYKKAHGVSFSRACVELLQKGIEHNNKASKTGWNESEVTNAKR